MKSILTVAMIAAAAGTATAQLQNVQPIQTGEPVMTVRADGTFHRVAQTPNTKAGLDGNTYGITHYNGDADGGLFVLNDGTDLFVSAGQVAQFPLNFTGISGARNFYYNDGDAAWASTTTVPQIVVDSTDLADGFDGMLNMDSDQDLAPGERYLTIRTWFNSNGASVRPFAQPSDDLVTFDMLYTPTDPGVNDLTVPDAERHPVSLGMDIGINSGQGLEPPAGRVWDLQPTDSVLEITMLGFRNVDGAFVGATFDTSAELLLNVDGNGDLTVDGLVIQPAGLALNLFTGRDDLSLGFGDIAWGDGVTDGFLVYALQIEMIVSDSDGGGPVCIGDIADDNGFLGADGMVSFGDFLALLGLLGPCPGGTPGCTGDIADDNGFLGGDAMVSFGDFLALLGLLGPCP